jgi:hypothetical protein
MAVVAVPALFAFPRASRADNELFESMLRSGIEVGPRENLRLPPPTLPDGLSAKEQRAAIEALPDLRHSWEALVRKSAVAPFVYQIPPEQKGRLGRRFDLWFIVHGSLPVVGLSPWLNYQFPVPTEDDDPESGTSLRLLSQSDLEKRGLPIPQRLEDPRRVAARFTILERVRLSATAVSVRTQNKESILVATTLDPKFVDDPEFPNQWRALSRDEAGKRQIGPPHPYSGFGSYVKITKLAEPAGALFIEWHLGFSEPRGWFEGANLLRSKLPIVAQTIVRDVRRRLEKVGATR